MKTTSKPLPDPALDADALYFGDNGRVFCGASSRCAGASAYYSGRTISGHLVDRVTAADAAWWLEEIGEPIRCECCKKAFTA